MRKQNACFNKGMDYRTRLSEIHAPRHSGESSVRNLIQCQNPASSSNTLAPPTSPRSPSFRRKPESRVHEQHPHAPAPNDESLGYFCRPFGQNDNSPDIHVWVSSLNLTTLPAGEGQEEGDLQKNRPNNVYSLQILQLSLFKDTSS